MNQKRVFHIIEITCPVIFLILFCIALFERDGTESHVGKVFTMTAAQAA